MEIQVMKKTCINCWRTFYPNPDNEDEMRGYCPSCNLSFDKMLEHLEKLEALIIKNISKKYTPST